MAVKLHRCSGTWAKFGAHPCWRVQKALDEQGVEYEVVQEGSAFKSSSRPHTIEKTGQKKFPWIEFEDGERLILIDPIAVPDDVRALFGSREVVTVLTSTWHERDAASLGFPVWAPAPDRPEDQLVPATRYAIGDSLFGLEAYPGREGQLDLVLWSERIRAVIAGDTLINLSNGLEIPASWLPEGVTVEQVATGLRPLLA